jgi:hypothetical protein
MNREQVVAWAREADLWLTSDERIAAVERFAALVADAEAKRMHAEATVEGIAQSCAAAIRARGTNHG